MRQLGIISGKGGTGKTSLAAAFVRLARRCIAADCDVDAANLGILLQGGEDRREPFYAGQRARIDMDLCDGCGLCLEHCRYEAIDEEGFFLHVAPLRCEGCGVCHLVCPLGAVSLYENQAGELLVRSIEEGMLVHARLGVAQDNSGKLVARVRQEARLLAEEKEIDLILVDGPPGIGCPVHAAVGDLDGLLVVTEPSPSGEHDLLRALELARHFHLPAAVALNKYDLAPHKAADIENQCAKYDVPLLGRVPFDPAFPRLLSRGLVPLGEDLQPQTTAAIKDLWHAFNHSTS